MVKESAFSTLFMQAGVNPQSMDPAISGDSVVNLKLPHCKVAAVIDGAWVRGFENAPHGFDIAHWSSSTIAHLFELHASNLGSGLTARAIVEKTIPDYAARCDDVFRAHGQRLTPPSPYEDIDPRKLNPQSAFALVVVKPDKVEIAQVRDCVVFAEDHAGKITRLTPNQSSTVDNATSTMDIQHEGMAAYVAAMRAAHKPAFFEMLRQHMDSLFLAHNSYNFLNQPAKSPASWGMMTGEEDMLPLMTHLTKRLWVTSDGAFKRGSPIEDMAHIRDLGPQQYYETMHKQRFDCHHPTIAPVDVTIGSIELA